MPKPEGKLLSRVKQQKVESEEGCEAENKRAWSRHSDESKGRKADYARFKYQLERQHGQVIKV